MDTFPTGTASALARCVSAEVRARMAAQRLTIREFSMRAGFSSHNYPAKRNRDELPYTLDDLERICLLFDSEPADFVQAAWDNHYERVRYELDQARSAAADWARTKAAFEATTAAMQAVLEEAPSADESRLRAVAQEGEIEGPGEPDA